MSVRCHICGRNVDSYYNVRRRNDDDGCSDYLCPDCFNRECKNNDAHTWEKEEIERQIAMVEKQIESVKRAHWMMWDEWERFNKAGTFASTFFWERPPAKPVNYAEVCQLYDILQELHNQLYQDNRRYFISKYETLHSDQPKAQKSSSSFSVPIRQSIAPMPPIDTRIKRLISLEEGKSKLKQQLIALETQKKNEESLHRFLEGKGTVEDIDRVKNGFWVYDEPTKIEIVSSKYATHDILYSYLDKLGFHEDRNVLIRARILSNKSFNASHLINLIPKFSCWSDYAAASKNTNPNIPKHYRDLFKAYIDLRDGKLEANKLPQEVKLFYLNNPKLFAKQKSEGEISKNSGDIELLNAVWKNNGNQEIIRENLISNPNTPIRLLLMIMDANRSKKDVCQRIYKTPQYRKWNRDYKKEEALNVVKNIGIGILGYTLFASLIIGAFVGIIFLFGSLF